MQNHGDEERVCEARAKKKVVENNTWPGWRGEDRTGRVAFLPDRLPTKPLWRRSLPSQGLGGVAANDRVVIVSGRDLNDTHDLWRCLDAESGDTLWSFRYAAPGSLDFGQSPRATPLIHGGIAYCYGAFGHLHAINVATGKVVWKRDPPADAAKDLPWGLCGSPLIAAGKLLYYAGEPNAALIAIDLKTGAVLWQTRGAKPAYCSFNAATLGGVEQIVGYDATTLGGWDVASGKRLWTLKPERPKDFNVPTPIVWDGRIVVSTENNGTRMYGFGVGGVIQAKPLAENADLRPDTHTPVRVGTRLFGIHDGLHCLDLAARLQRIWHFEDDALHEYASALASDNRVLVVTHNCEGLLFDADKLALLDRKKLVDDEKSIYAHPAYADGRMYLRTSDAVVCFKLN